MTDVPSNLIPVRITQLPYAPVASEESLLNIVYEGNNYQIRAADLLQVAGVPTSRAVLAGTGLSGGGQLSADVTLSIAPGGVGSTQLNNTGVAPGTYGDNTNIPVFTVDANGRVTAASSIAVSVSGYVPVTRQVIAGTGLTGGGALNNNVTLGVNLSDNAPLRGHLTGVSGTSNQSARYDHQHPSVNLASSEEVEGVLSLANGGTSRSIVPDNGAIIWSGADGLYVGPVGAAGQLLRSTGAGEYVWVDLSAGSTGLTLTDNGSSITLGGSLNIAHGGTGATTLLAARANLFPNYAGNGGKVLAVNSTDTDVEWIPAAGAGTVTSVSVSGGTTGLTTSGNPITGAGIITFGGTLNTDHGGTGITSYTAGDLTYYASGSALSKLNIGTNTYMLTSSGSAPQWTNPSSVSVGNLIGGSGGSIPYQSSAGATTFLASGTGVLVASGGNPSYTASPSLTQVTVAADPTLALQVATKQYVDTIATTSVHYHTSVKYEVPTINLNATYNQPGGPGDGVGATLTNAGALVAFAPDGPTASVGDRILVYNQTSAFQNGIYTVTVVGDGSTNWVLTRATDANTYDPISPNALGGGDAFFITSGSTGAGETYVCNNVGAITFGSTSITFVQISDTQIYSAGTGLTLSGTQFSLTTPVATSNGGTGLSSYTSGGAVYATSTSALTTGTLPITAGGTGQTTASAAFNALSPVTTTGDLIVGNGSNSATRLGIGANGYILTSNGTTASWGAPPSSMVYPDVGIPNSTGSAWGTSYTTTGSGTVVALAASPVFTTPNLGTPSAVTLTNATDLPLTTGVTGTLGVANGGTGATTLTANAVVLGNGTSAVQTVAPSTSGNVLTSNGTTWVSQAPAASGVSQAKATALSMILGF